MEFRWSERTFTVRGQAVTHRFLRLGAVAAVLARDGAGRVLLVRQYRAAVDRRTLEVPAGFAEPGESPQAAAARELEEETGYRARTLEPVLSFWPVPGYSTERLHLFAASDLERTATRFDPGEDIALELLDDGACEAAVRSGEICDAKTLVALMAARLGWRGRAGEGPESVRP